MFTVRGDEYRHCDGVTRRGFLAAGALGMGGLTLADLLRAEETARIRGSHKSIIFVHLDGGPPQMDTIDLKPNAPTEIRGEFKPISTRVPGFQIGELLPRMAGIADRFAFIRSLVGSAGRHDAFQCQSGYNVKDMAAVGGRPAMGSVISKLKGRPSDVAPAFVDLMQGRPLVRNSARPGFFGPSYKPFRPDISKLFERALEEGMKGELARLGGDHSVSLTLNSEISINRLNDRRQLLAGLDRIRHEVDATGMMDAMDRFEQQAVGILTSGRLADALDLEKEDPRVLAKFTPSSQDDSDRFATADGSMAVRKFLLARRLIEAGVRIVSLSISDFDTHSKNFPRMRHALPLVDHGLHALVTDLEERGMLDDVTIVAWGEFGRTPRINAKGGRDHWPRVGPVILAGGGLRTGQVIGATDRTAGTAVARPVHYKDIFVTLYRNLGIDARGTTTIDPHGRPQYLMDDGEPLQELI
ncbi:MAG: DUF1501 domain-containing protein [Planctomycetaceae bacterium]|jgi:hypothetical protein|nr:DUF1501 domain-containing protein [Planctomycetaceae bacterium]MBT6157328.1 DUF1501 domain-containing protein [Planctomycetaceae bacterium]MBT6487789.1 DUF1501 domain-containing protein [Planctomycetaceae bacterium]MBT6494561.1 DUF1501 domain-containing protein [Planctomycetaceae bacterium]